MKLTLIGGGSVRTPMFVASALRRAEKVGLQELCLMDIDATKLSSIGALCRGIVYKAGRTIDITITTDARQALQNADYVVTSIRVGGDQGRVIDERIALKHGVLGQETTGPGGFAMALRSIPAILGYAELMKELCPDAWMFNFTNPAGLVAQALHYAGYNRVIGICDSANSAQRAIATRLDVPMNNLRPEVFGLNHLSWVRGVSYNGEDMLPQFLEDPDFLSGTIQNVFEPELVRRFGMWLNEYLYYFYYAERAVHAILADAKTRGEEIVELNRIFLEQLNSIDIEHNLEQALYAYYRYYKRRASTYMHYARENAPSLEEADTQFREIFDEIDPDEGEGYAGVAFDVIEAIVSGKPCYTALNVPNGKAISGMRADDVVEVSCIVEESGPQPLSIGEIPEAQAALMQAIKRYERLTVEAVIKRSRSIAIDALMAHPLVLSYSRAVTLVSEYLAAHAAHVGEWD